MSVMFCSAMGLIRLVVCKGLDVEIFCQIFTKYAIALVLGHLLKMNVIVLLRPFLKQTRPCLI